MECMLFVLIICVCVFFLFKQKTAYEMRISDWSSDVCSSDLPAPIYSGAVADRRRSRHAAAQRRAQFRSAGLGDGGGAARDRAAARAAAAPFGDAGRAMRGRSEERRVGQVCVSTCRSRWSQSHSKQTSSRYK